MLLEAPDEPSPSEGGEEDQQDDYHDEYPDPASPHGSSHPSSAHTPHLTGSPIDVSARSEFNAIRTPNPRYLFFRGSDCVTNT